MEDNAGNTLEELRLIFNHCQPNKDGLISLKNLQALFAQQSNQVRKNNFKIKQSCKASGLKSEKSST